LNDCEKNWTIARRSARARGKKEELQVGEEVRRGGGGGGKVCKSGPATGGVVRRVETGVLLCHGA
jgi:hypothetical protein